MVQTMTATGLSLSKTRKKEEEKNIRKSGGGSKAYRLRRILERLSAIKDACGVARLIWGLPTLRYVDECCCKDNQHLNNIKEEEIGTNQNGVKSGVNQTMYGFLIGRVQIGLEVLIVFIRRKAKVDEL